MRMPCEIHGETSCMPSIKDRGQTGHATKFAGSNSNPDLDLDLNT